MITDGRDDCYESIVTGILMNVPDIGNQPGGSDAKLRAAPKRRRPCRRKDNASEIILFSLY